MVKKFSGEYRWEGVDLLPYKETGTHFKSISRQILSHGVGDMPIELRYFEMAPGGHSTLEKHQHGHLVLILRGKGRVLVGDTITEIGEHDTVEIGPMIWHQFQANENEPLGFLCCVCQERDKPHLPNESDLIELRSHSLVKEYIKV